MKQLSFVILAIALLTIGAFAQGTPSSKATASINTAVGCTFATVSTIGDTLPVNCKDIFKGTAVPVTADNFAEIMKSDQGFEQPIPVRVAFARDWTLHSNQNKNESGCQFDCHRLGWRVSKGHHQKPGDRG